MESDTYYEGATVIRRSDEFDALYADSGCVQVSAPRHKVMVKFKDAVEQFDDDDLAAIREYDRAKYGGFVNA